MNTNAKSQFLNLVLAALFVATALRLTLFVMRFNYESLQMDFSAFYTAGEAINRGLSPYHNNILSRPPVWDGVDVRQHSRFLYPPLVANAFQIFALLPYLPAKIIWTLLTLACVVIVLYFSARVFPLGSGWQVLLVGILAGLYHPLLTHLERGQIDVFTLVLIIAAIYLMQQPSGRMKIMAGGAMALATLLKLQNLYLLPFLFITRQWKVVKGYMLGAAVVLIVSVLFPGGKILLVDYARNEFPRISRFGQGGTASMMIDVQATKAVRADLRKGVTVKGGRAYRVSYFGFVSNATIVRPLQYWLGRVGFVASPSMISLGLFSASILFVWLWYRRIATPALSADKRTFVFWQMILAIIVLTGPLGWAMNAVWFLPGIVIVVSEYSSLDSRKRISSLFFLLIGLIIIGAPEGVGFPLLVSKDYELVVFNRYITGEIVYIMGCALYLGDGSNSDFSPPNQLDPRGARG